MPPSPADHSCIMYLVRHGATASNLAKPVRLQGRGVNQELSPKGVNQAEQTAKFLASKKISAVYSSSLLRARQTADTIARPHALSVRLVEEILEVDVGDWEGKSWDEVERLYPQAYQNYMHDPALHGYVGGESLSQVQARVVPAFRQIMKANLGKEIVVVGHNVVNRVFLAFLLNLPIKESLRISQDNCGINVVRFRNEKLKLRTANATFHLEL